jgi:hypothetical protein
MTINRCFLAVFHLSKNFRYGIWAPWVLRQLLCLLCLQCLLCLLCLLSLYVALLEVSAAFAPRVLVVLGDGHSAVALLVLVMLTT